MLSNSTFYKLSIDISFVGVSLKRAREQIFFWRTPAKVWSNLSVSANLTNVGSLAVGAFDLVNCSLSLVRFVPVFNVG